MEIETPRDRSSFRDVAKLAAQPEPAKRESRRPSPDSSGVVDLEAIMKSQPGWLDDALARAKGGPASMPSSSSLSALAAPVLLAPPSLMPTSFDEVPLGVPRSSIALIAATIGAIALVVAATGFALKMQTQRAPHVAAASAVLPPVSHVEDSIPPPPPVAEVTNAPAQAQAAAAPAQASDTNTAQDNASAPPVETATPSRHGHGHGVHHAALSHFTPSAPVAAAAPPPPVASKPAKATSALDAALRSAAGPIAAAPPPSAPASAPAPAARASAPSGDRPDRPSGSAVTSALTGALPAARACLTGGVDPSHARVTFGSDGNVRSVELTGPAASDAHATSCVRSAFGRAHVPPFAQPTYSAGVNVRPR